MQWRVNPEPMVNPDGREIIDFRFVDADADTWNPDRMNKSLDQWEKIKKDKNGQHCYD